MDRLGFIHEKLDIKILILFILRRLPAAISFETLSDLILIDDGFDYFDYVQCLSELVDTGHVSHSDGVYKITAKGVEHGNTVESSIPFSVRSKAERNAKPLIEQMKRDALIGTSHELLSDGGCMVKLSLSDGVGEIFSLSILTSGEERAQIIEKNFRSGAEGFYLKITELLTNQ